MLELRSFLLLYMVFRSTLRHLKRQHLRQHWAEADPLHVHRSKLHVPSLGLSVTRQRPTRAK